LAEGNEPDAVGGAATTAPEASIDPHSGAVFISYASADVAVADSVVASLESHGLQCWIAPRDVRAGALYAEAIVRAISDAKALILVLSANSVASAHVGKEVERASSKRRPVIALRIDEAPLSPALEYFLSESHWIDARTGGMDAALAKLVAAIREPERDAPAIIPAAAARASAGTASASPPRSPRFRILLVAGLAVVAVALGALLAGKFWLTKRVTAQRPTSVATSAVNDKSIAVLPFTDMSENKDHEYFADGMAEEILDLLAKLPGLAVIGRTSSFQFKGKNEDLRTIGKQLNAAYVLEGSVRNSGDQVRITAQLINTRTGTHEWSDTYDRHIGDVLKLQDAIAAAVVRELQLTVDSGYLNSRATLKSAEAYDLMLRGRHAADRFDKEGLDEAVALFKQALDRDPTSVDAAAGLAYTYYNLGAYGFQAPAVAYEQSRRAATNVLKLDPSSESAHWTLGSIHLLYDWNWAAADQDYQQVAALAPGTGDARNGKAWLALVLGRWDEGLSQITAALAQDPLNPVSYECLTWIQMGRAHLSEAEAAIRRALIIRPTYSWGHFMLGLVLLEKGNPEAALLEMQQEQQEVGQLSGLAMVYHALRRKADADATLARMLKEQAVDNAFQIASVYAFRHQPEEAMRWLERAYAQRDFSLYLIKGYLPLQTLAADPRFKAFLRKMNLPVRDDVAD
jgi:TolB-like protein/thioredoxin-like negative regulator of GroEL